MWAYHTCLTFNTRLRKHEQCMTLYLKNLWPAFLCFVWHGGHEQMSSIISYLLACLLACLLTYLLTLPTVNQERTTRSDTNNDCDVIGNPRVRRAQHTTHVNEKIELTTKFQIHDKRAQLTWPLPYRGWIRGLFSCKDALISTHYLTLPYLLACLLACLLTYLTWPDLT